MIVGKRKNLDELATKISGMDSILIAGCRACMTVCHSGGEKQVDELASELELDALRHHTTLTIRTAMVERQCDREFNEDLAVIVPSIKAIITLGCGAGAQTLASMFPNTLIIPGINTQFIGSHTQNMQWDEYCLGCGNCTIDTFGGYCPISRCSKSLQNGPCGGSQEDHCECDPEIECIWQRIIEKLTQQGNLDTLQEIRPPKNWCTSRFNEPRRRKLEDDTP